MIDGAREWWGFEYQESYEEGSELVEAYLLLSIQKLKQEGYVAYVVGSRSSEPPLAPKEIYLVRGQERLESF